MIAVLNAANESSGCDFGCARPTEAGFEEGERGVIRPPALPSATVCIGSALALALAISLSPVAAENLPPPPKPCMAPVSTEVCAVPQVKVVPPAPAPLKLRMDAPARDYFGKMTRPAAMRPQAIGSYAKGCQAGAVALPPNGRGFQVMRLSRNRFWGQPELIDYLEDLGRDAPKLGWRGLMVGDMAQPRGGPMTSGHASHQIGLNADIWLKQMPDHIMSASERENVSAVSMLRGRLDVKGADRSVDPKKFTAAHARLIRRAALVGAPLSFPCQAEVSGRR